MISINANEPTLSHNNDTYIMYNRFNNSGPVRVRYPIGIEITDEGRFPAPDSQLGDLVMAASRTIRADGTTSLRVIGERAEDPSVEVLRWEYEAPSTHSDARIEEIAYAFLKVMEDGYGVTNIA